MSDIHTPGGGGADDVDPNDPRSEESSSYNITPDPAAGGDALPTADDDADPETAGTPDASAALDEEGSQPGTNPSGVGI